MNAKWVVLGCAVAMGLLIRQASAEPTPASPSAMLEEGVYYEETAGDPAKAIDVYRKILAEAATNRATVAEALFRLGMCLEKIGKKEEARGCFERVVREYPEQTALVSRAQQKLAAKLEIGPAPWKSGETHEMKMVAPTGVEVGTAVWTVRESSTNGILTYTVESTLDVPLAATHQFTRVEAQRDSFAPVTGLTQNKLGEFFARYSPGKVDLTIKANGSDSVRSIEVDRQVYDNEEVLYLIRRLPLADGYKATIPIFPVQGGVVVDCEVAVLAKESVTVDAGTFECYKVSITVMSGGIKALEHSAWFSADSHRYFVKYDAGTAQILLQKITVQGPAAQRGYFMDRALGFQVNAPQGWVFADAPYGDLKRGLQLIPPDSTGKTYYFGVAARKPEWNSARDAAAAASMIEKGKAFLVGYTARPDSWKDITVAGLSGVTYIADYKDKDTAMVEYRAILWNTDDIDAFVFRIDLDRFEQEKPVLDSLVNGFQLVEKK